MVSQFQNIRRSKWLTLTPQISYCVFCDVGKFLFRFLIWSLLPRPEHLWIICIVDNINIYNFHCAVFVLEWMVNTEHCICRLVAPMGLSLSKIRNRKIKKLINWQSWAVPTLHTIRDRMKGYSWVVFTTKDTLFRRIEKIFSFLHSASSKILYRRWRCWK